MAVTKVATDQQSDTTSSTTFDITLSTLANELLLVFMWHKIGTRTHTSMVLDPSGVNESLTQLGTLEEKTESGEQMAVSVWYIDGPSVVTSVPLRATFSSAIFYKGISYVRVNGHAAGAPTLTQSSTVSNQTNIDNTIDPVAADNLVASLAHVRTDFFTLTLDNGTTDQTETNTNNINSRTSLGTFAETDLTSHLFGWTNSGNALIHVLMNVVIEPAATGQDVSVIQAVETDTAFTIQHSKQLGIAQAIETDTAFIVRPNRSYDVLQALETDTAFVFAPARSVAIATASETDTAFNFAKTKDQAIGISSETDTALDIRPNRDYNVLQAVETDTAFTVVHTKTINIAQAAETDTAFIVVPNKDIATVQAIETDTAFAITIGQAAKNINVGIVAETDTAFVIVRAKDQAIGQAVETDTAFLIGINRSVSVVQSIETDTAFGIVHTRAVDVNIASETDTAFNILPSIVVTDPIGRIIGPVTPTRLGLVEPPRTA